MGLLQEAQLARLTIQHIGRILEGRTRWYGMRAPQTATQWGAQATLLPYVVTSGAGVFGPNPGDEALVIGSADTPIFAGHQGFAIDKFMVSVQSNVTPYILRFIWGTGTMANAEAAGQYSDYMYISTVALVMVAGGVIVDMPDIAVANGTQI